MTKAEISRTLAYMERLRMDSYEADTEEEEAELVAEYGRLWKTVEPYLRGGE